MAQAEGFKIGISNTVQGYGWREQMVCAMKAGALASGKVASLNIAHRTTDAAGQLEDIRNRIQAAVNAIVVNPSNSEGINSAIKEATDSGRSVIYISHRFTEIAAICDRATVLRDGMTVADVAIAPGIEESIVEMMPGAMAAENRGAARTAPAQTGMPRPRVRNLATGTRLTDVSLDLRRGEVPGVVALEGQGQDELFDVLAGNRRAAAGTVEVDGQALTFSQPAYAIAARLMPVPGDRAQALLMQRPVRENIAAPLLARLVAWGPIPMAAERTKVDAAIEWLQIDTRAQGEVRRLSCLGRQRDLFPL